MAVSPRLSRLMYITYYLSNCGFFSFVLELENFVLFCLVICVFRISIAKNTHLNEIRERQDSSCLMASRHNVIRVRRWHSPDRNIHTEIQIPVFILFPVARIVPLIAIVFILVFTVVFTFVSLVFTSVFILVFTFILVSLSSLTCNPEPLCRVDCREFDMNR